jgi:hypothetical protein
MTAVFSAKWAEASRPLSRLVVLPVSPYGIVVVDVSH